MVGARWTCGGLLPDHGVAEALGVGAAADDLTAGGDVRGPAAPPPGHAAAPGHHAAPPQERLAALRGVGDADDLAPFVDAERVAVRPAQRPEVDSGAVAPQRGPVDAEAAREAAEPDGMTAIVDGV